MIIPRGSYNGSFPLENSIAQSISMDILLKPDRLLRVLQDSAATKWTVLSLVAGLTLVSGWYGVERLQSRARLQNGETHGRVDL